MLQVPEVLKLKNLSPPLNRLDGLNDAKPSDPKLAAVSVLQVADGAKAHILSQIRLKQLVITSDALAARSLASRLRSWGVKVDYLPFRDDPLIARRGASYANMYERLGALRDIAFDDVDIVVAAADCLLQRFPKRELIKKYSISFKKGGIFPPGEAAKRLALAGYHRQETVSEIGDFALRGDILDVCSLSGTAYRINFFDDLVEDIKVFDMESMLSSNEVEYIRLAPLSDILLDGEGYDLTFARLGQYINVKNAAAARSAINEGACSPAAVWALPFMEECTQPLLEYLTEDTLVVFDEPKIVNEKLNLLLKEFDSRVKTFVDAGEALKNHRDVYITYHELRRELVTKRKFSFSSVSLSNPIFDPTLTLSPRTKQMTKYYLDPNTLISDLKVSVLNGVRTIIATGSRERAKSVISGLLEGEIFGEYSEDGNGEGNVLVTPLSIETGVAYPDSKVQLIGVSECAGKHRGESVIAQKSKFIAPKAGDYVVHRIHGVGLCEGTTRMKAGEFEREYVVIRYKDGDKLYVATDQMNNLQKFIGEEHPALNKLGGKEFEKEKEKVRKSVRKLAVNLIELYARREKQRGFKYSEDTVWQKEFEDSFEYEETADQLKAIADIKNDMQTGRIMDRLLVGDVGFGKTEVAFRAMFKTVFDGKQAALLAPTTILARQHYENLAPRLEPFGIRLGLLTRLQSDKENAKLLEELKLGTIHLVIATHKVLSKKVEFCDLGLLVLDEEQRFGVEHKETLKERYPLVNVLTLSATPIPRTLNMSLSGIRDISMLETAPHGRLPVQTYVSPYSDALVVDAVNREVARGGQTLILCNNIDMLDPYAARLAALTDGARIITAHGQMAPGMLERRIGDFYDKKYDVLISTTIIENGIDLPDANTLIVLDSQNFGLSQLYQLRGRVGRRGALAHAYFTVPSDDSISPTAMKRLNTLLENTEIGSGFRVALADMSIRGAGNLLGAEQSGHIEKVGYEMYLEILDETVRELKTGVVAKPIKDVEMRIDAAAFINDGYVGSRDKLRIYKRIAEVCSIQGRDSLMKELEEVYGPVDLPLENLINISLLKNLAARFDVSRIIIFQNGAGANFYDAEIFKNEQLMKAVADYKDKVVLTNTIPPTLIFESNHKTPEQKLRLMIEFFSYAGNL